MRFLFDYVTCCMMINTSSMPNSTDEPSSPVTPKSEETRSLVTPAPAIINRRRKRVPTRGTSADWRPSLFAISEDNAVAAVPEKAAEKVHRQVAPPARQSGSRNVKQCRPSSARVNAQSRSHDFSRDPIPMVVPAFSAAPFLF